ncbi:MAG: YgiT-type zinc finger protein [Candidatus Subteraquimicrobiales bacterium]|nr:YgiT-type zinc finger protein [Candidatus Subteraquimicrobiales bacterium]
MGVIIFSCHLMTFLFTNLLLLMKDGCVLCGGQKVAGTTTFTTDFGFGVLVIRNVPASVCQKCGEDWVDDNTAQELEKLARKARAAHRQVEIIDYQKAA